MKEEILSIIKNINSELCITHKQNILLQDDKKYNRCYSAIYLLEDITEAIEYYKTYNGSKLALGAKYLMVYGVLEALFLQQHALNDLLDALDYGNINYKKDYPEIYTIRETRNDVAGHPTNRTSAQYTTYLSRPDLSLEKIRYEETLHGKFIDFDIISSIETQEKFIKNQLEEILNKLIKEKKEHIEKFKNDKLMDCFQMFNYAHEKMYSISGFYTQNDTLGFSLVKGIIEKLKTKLNERFTNWENTNFASDIKFVEEIHKYLLLKAEIINEEGEENKFLKINLLENMFSHLKELQDMAKEVDADYENDFKVEYTDDVTVLPKIIFKDENGEEVELNV